MDLKIGPKNPKMDFVKPLEFLLTSVYIYSLLTTLRALQKTTTIRMLFEATLRPFSGFEKTVDEICFDAHFRKILCDFWWFWTILTEMDIFGPFWGPKQPPVQKSRYICLYPLWTSKPKPKPLLFWLNFVTIWTLEVPRGGCG